MPVELVHVLKAPTNWMATNAFYANYVRLGYLYREANGARTQEQTISTYNICAQTLSEYNVTYCSVYFIPNLRIFHAYRMDNKHYIGLLHVVLSAVSYLLHDQLHSIRASLHVERDVKI